MARPIEPTPILSGKDAEEFIRLTLEAEKTVDVKRAAFLKSCAELYARHPF